MWSMPSATVSWPSATSSTYEYEVAIVDWRMPKLSGLEVIQRLRRRGPPFPSSCSPPATPRVTASAGGLTQGADDYLVKPFDFSELLAQSAGIATSRKASQSPR